MLSPVRLANLRSKLSLIDRAPCLRPSAAALAPSPSAMGRVRTRAESAAEKRLDDDGLASIVGAQPSDRGRRSSRRAHALRPGKRIFCAGTRFLRPGGARARTDDDISGYHLIDPSEQEPRTLPTNGDKNRRQTDDHRCHRDAGTERIAAQTIRREARLGQRNSRFVESFQLGKLIGNGLKNATPSQKRPTCQSHLD